MVPAAVKGTPIFPVLLKHYLVFAVIIPHMCANQNDSHAVWHQWQSASLVGPSTSRNLAGANLRASRMKAARRLHSSVLCTIRKSAHDPALSSYSRDPVWHHPWHLQSGARKTGMPNAQCRAARTEAAGSSDAATVLVVESPAKARKIQGFLGGSYKARPVAPQYTLPPLLLLGLRAP